MTGVLVLKMIVVPSYAIPTPPSPPPAPSPIDAPMEPTPPPAPTPPSMPSPPSETINSPKPSASPKQKPTPPPAPSPEASPVLVQNNDTQTNEDSPTSSGTPITENSTGGGGTLGGQVQGETTGNQDGSHGRGDPTIDTGDATVAGIITNNANLNTNGSGGTGSAGDIYVGNTGNGADSQNTGEVNTTNDSQTIQTNNAVIGNSADLASISGQNDTSYNVGSTSITTGDANTSAAVINGVNTNIDGVAVVEFNVDDTHTGDIVLAFPTTSCGQVGCGAAGDVTAKNTLNGSGSVNDAGVASVNDQMTFQNNTADVVNDLTLVADSGSNEASYNTGGDNTITTGDANVVATVGNFVNNNIAGAGDVLIAVVNIFGDLVGNILLPESTIASSGMTAANTGNGSNTTNTAGITTTNTSSTQQANTANIINNLDVTAVSGENVAENNTAGFSNGENVINSGDANLDVNVVNIANNNVSGGDTWWLVFVNDASGNWVGKIMGAPEGASMAGSIGTEFIVATDGSIIAQNGNGSGSTNSADVTNTNTSTLTQTNTASIVNNLNLTANTGNNEASYNTGGANKIRTGDASVMANIVNFVNNNFSGGKVVVSIVNVFGSWFGSFVPPGYETPTLGSTGGTPPNEQQAMANNSQGGSNGSGNTDNHPSTSNTNTVSPFEVSLYNSASKRAKQGGVLGFSNSLFKPFTKQEESIEEDDAIVVPGKVKTAAATNRLPDVFWKIFAVALLLLIAKKGYQLFKTYRTAHFVKI